MDFVAFYWVRLVVSKCDQVSTIYLVSSVLHKNIVTFSLAGNKIVCLFIYKSLILHTLSHIRTMSSSYSIRRIWRWKETTELKRSTQRVMCICLCVSLWSKELQATPAWITYTAEAVAVGPGDKRLPVWHFCFTDTDNLFQRNRHCSDCCGAMVHFHQKRIDMLNLSKT